MNTTERIVIAVFIAAFAFTYWQLAIGIAVLIAGTLVCLDTPR